jgi:putative pyoverdin transport system ATP-binding/permease protein
MLKRNGKGVIVVTHDDRYFEFADKLIKLERGEVIESYENNA